MLHGTNVEAVKTCYKGNINSKTYVYDIPSLSLLYLTGKRYGLNKKHCKKVSVTCQLLLDVRTVLRVIQSVSDMTVEKLARSRTLSCRRSQDGIHFTGKHVLPNSNYF